MVKAPPALWAGVEYRPLCPWLERLRSVSDHSQRRPGTQMPSFAALPADDIWRAVTYIKSLSAQSGGNEVGSGNSTAGEALFFGAGHCTSCHEVNGRGAAIAADLSGEGAKPLGAIRSGVAHKMPPGFRTPPHFADVTTSDGHSVHGFVTVEDSFAIALLVDRKNVVLDKKNIRNIAATSDALPHDISLTSEQVENLVAYLAKQERRDLYTDLQVSAFTHSKLRAPGK